MPAGAFMMGSLEGEAERGIDEGLQRNVTLAKPFAVSKFEATFAEWDACVAAGACKHNPRDQGWGRGKRPSHGTISLRNTCRGSRGKQGNAIDC